MSKGDQANGFTEQKKRKEIKESPGGNEGGDKFAGYSHHMMNTVDVKPLS